MLTFSKKKETFTISRFDNWKKALERFNTHQHCSAHQGAVMKWQLARKSEQSISMYSQVLLTRSFKLLEDQLYRSSSMLSDFCYV